ncbi:MAG: hypothetical protein AABY15_08940 [Nanoarchaeota archaeon]
MKIILGLLAIADAFALQSIFKDFRATRNQEGYDELSIWRRIKFNLVSFMMITGMVSLFVFLVYFIIIKISIG